MMDNGCIAVLRRFNVKIGDEAKHYSIRDVEASTRTKCLSSNCTSDPGEENRNLLKCGMCGDVFISVNEISNHLKHSHLNTQAYDCGMCFKFFPCHKELEAHLLDNHLQSDSGPTPISRSPTIDVAEIEHFMKNSDLREKVELECPMCGCVYNKLALYQQHMSASHRGKAWDKDGLCIAVLKVTTVKSSSVKPVIRDDPNETGPGKVYICNCCDKKVYGREPMKRHAATHYENAIIQCSTCLEFFITNSSYIAHKEKTHPSLVNLNIKRNRHGDIIGSSLDDILKANDCLSKACSGTDKKALEKEKDSEKPNDEKKDSEKPSEKKVEEATYIDLDSQCVITHEVITIASPNPSNKKPEQHEENYEKPDHNEPDDLSPESEMNNEMLKADWKTHKRERSNDSLPDPENPQYNLLLLSKSAVREQKRLALGRDAAPDVPISITQGNDMSITKTGRELPPAKEHSPIDDSITKKLHCNEELAEKERLKIDNIMKKYHASNWYLSVFHLMTGLASLAAYKHVLKI